MLTREQFLEHVRDALGHLYDPNRLHQSPLAALFGVANQPDTHARLRRILTDAIASLEPSRDTPAQSRAWRIYDLLFCRYVQQLNAQVVAEQLGISVRHLRREQRDALEALAYRLWNQYDVGAAPPMGQRSTDRAPDEPDQPSVNEELAWLKDAPLDRPTDLREALSSALELARPLARQHRASVETSVAEGLAGLAVHPVALNQMLLSLLGAALAQSSGGVVRVSTRSRRWEVEVRIQGARLTGNMPPLSPENAAGLDMAGRLADLSGGHLAYTTGVDAFSAVLTLPAFEQLPVLVIDDNADTLRLLQHYVSGTRYRVVGTRDPEQAFALVEQLSPQVIVLDVMMPQVDGWRVLGRLRQHPLTSDVPIVVCTILSQGSLAYSLGASGFVHKPVTQQALLSALDRVAPKASESR